MLRERLGTDIVDTTAFHGWQTLNNGELLPAAEASGFDLFISADQNLPCQQHLRGRRIAILVLGTNHWNEIRAKLDKIISTIGMIQSGDTVSG